MSGFASNRLASPLSATLTHSDGCVFLCVGETNMNWLALHSPACISITCSWWGDCGGEGFFCRECWCPITIWGGRQNWWVMKLAQYHKISISSHQMKYTAMNVQIAQPALDVCCKAQFVFLTCAATWQTDVIEFLKAFQNISCFNTNTQELGLYLFYLERQQQSLSKYVAVTFTELTSVLMIYVIYRGGKKCWAIFVKCCVQKCVVIMTLSVHKASATAFSSRAFIVMLYLQ